MKDINENIGSLLERQFQGELNREEYAALVHIWETSFPVLNSPVFDTAAAWKKVRENAGGGAISGSRRILRFAWVAAACVLLAVAGWWYFGVQSQLGERTIFAADGNRILTLPDSSTIHLRKGSKLTYSQAFSTGRGPRVATLEGEAFFEVRHNAQRPFRINTRQATVEDLGTSFAIRQEDTACQVLVTAGTVKCTARNSPADAIILAAGERALLRAGGWTRYPGADPNFLSWKDRTLEFDESPLDSVLIAVQELYGVPVTLSADLRAKSDKIRITARFSAGEQLKDVLEEIRLTTGLGMQHEKDTIIFFEQ
ncbi:MAG TPA: FecR domain-containing protein [Puia sp.]|nr:FecR domain-containing protein [Puia sp.]